MGAGDKCGGAIDDNARAPGALQRQAEAAAKVGGADQRHRPLAVPQSVGATKVWIGHTLPRGSKVASVQLDGRTLSDWTTRTTNRGLEVTVPTKAGAHTLVVTTR